MVMMMSRRIAANANVVRTTAVVVVFAFLQLTMSPAGAQNPALPVQDAGQVKVKSASVKAGAFVSEDCDISLPGAICLFNGRKIVMPDAAPQGLVGRWTFDEVKVIDSSGNANHAIHSIPAGPGAFGNGASAMFNGFDFIEIPHGPSLDFTDFTVTFWMYLNKDPKSLNTHGEADCPVLRKGGAGKYNPGIRLNTQTRKLKIRLTTASEAVEAEDLDSRANVRMKSWVHVALVRSGKNVKLYVNGVLDSEKNTAQTSVTNVGKLFIGGTPDLIDKCHLAMYLDELRIYNRALGADHVEAEAGPALSGIEPSFARLGCSSCNLEASGSSCPETYHLCTAMELHTGGYQVARANGYADFKTRVWTHGEFKARTGKGSDKAVDKVFDVTTTADSPTANGVGMCCHDSR